PYHDPLRINNGGPHGADSAVADVNGGRMNGFIKSALVGIHHICHGLFDPHCTHLTSRHDDVMGYHDGRDIPNYWTYAHDFVLQDHMFEPNASWSLPAHLFMVSEWSAKCANRTDPFSCVNALQSPGPPPDQKSNARHIPPSY